MNINLHKIFFQTLMWRTMATNFCRYLVVFLALIAVLKTCIDMCLISFILFWSFLCGEKRKAFSFNECNEWHNLAFGCHWIFVQFPNWCQTMKLSLTRLTITHWILAQFSIIISQFLHFPLAHSNSRILKKPHSTKSQRLDYKRNCRRNPKLSKYSFDS